MKHSIGFKRLGVEVQDITREQLERTNESGRPQPYTHSTIEDCCKNTPVMLFGGCDYGCACGTANWGDDDAQADVAAAADVAVMMMMMTTTS